MLNLLPTTALLLLAPLAAQCPPGAPMPRDNSLETTLPATGPAQKRVQTALTARQTGDLANARRHLFAALEFHPSSPELLLELICTCDDNLDALTQWTERYTRALADERGRIKVDGPDKKKLRAIKKADKLIKSHQALTTKRTAAINEIARFITKQKSAGKETAARALLVRWASELLLKAGISTPNAVEKVAAKIDQHQAEFQPDYEIIYAALAKVMKQPVPKSTAPDVGPTTGTSSDPRVINDQRIRAARILVGLARQIGFKDLKGPRPAGPGALAEQARKVLEAERSQDVAGGKIWSIAELEDMTAEEAIRFTEDHRDWHHPGLALSTNGLYRIETICGHDTLLQTAKTIELHHQRLISHFGKDPFNGRQGIARIVPEHNDLETEGAPFWWAGGFQAGDRTTVRFAWGNIPGLGRTLTHELTHRFDGVMRPFMPSWYTEGHADWTSGHYGKMTDKEFVTNFLKKGTAAHTYYKGYGRKQKFEQLLTGEIDDYRDNYFAGYSLYSFLMTYPPKAPRYRSAMAKYERNARAGQRNPLGYFQATFCDGKDGRPAEFDELYKEWAKFVRDCYDWQDRKRDNNQWLRDYRGTVKGEGAPMVMDVPTRSWARNHAEPFYGQEHAAAATILLDEVGDIKGTIASGVWSITADGWRPEVTRSLARALATSRLQDASAAFASLANAHFPEITTIDGGRLLAQLPKTKILLDTLAEYVDSLVAQKLPNAASALAREHASMAKSFGKKPMAHATINTIDRLPRHLGSSGFSESELTGYEDRRNKGLWYVTPEGDLHVGRKKPREGTGVLDRRAHQRDAFAHTVDWQTPGHFVVRGRVHWTTSFVSGAIILGHTRRDRSVRINFSSGDFNYAIGKSETNNQRGVVSISLAGLWERDGRVPGTKPSQSVEIPEKQNWFAYELHVRGPRVEVIINGEPLLRYAVHDGTPIEGHIGFATSTGAIRVQQPTVQRLDNEITSPVVGLDITKQPTVDLEELMQLQTRGLPIHPDGTLVIWLPKLGDGETSDRLGRAIRPLSKILQNALDYPQVWVLAVPSGMDPAEKKEILSALQEVHPRAFPMVEHSIGDPFDTRNPWVLFLDAQGVLRAAANSRDSGIFTLVAQWSKIFRGR